MYIGFRWFEPLKSGILRLNPYNFAIFINDQFGVLLFFELNEPLIDFLKS